MSEFIALTEVLPPDEAWASLEQALKRHDLQVEDLDPETDVIVDTFRNATGEVLNRYRVRKERLEQQ